MIGTGNVMLEEHPAVSLIHRNCPLLTPQWESASTFPGWQEPRQSVQSRDWCPRLPGWALHHTDRLVGWGVMEKSMNSHITNASGSFCLSRHLTWPPQTQKGHRNKDCSPPSCSSDSHLAHGMWENSLVRETPKVSEKWKHRLCPERKGQNGHPGIQEQGMKVSQINPQTKGE